MMKDANIEGFFTNHRLRRTGGTRLFRAGVDRKLVKEVTGHRSDAVDAYQITSDEQRKHMSRVIEKPMLDAERKVTSVHNVVGDEGRQGKVKLKLYLNVVKLIKSLKRLDDGNVGLIVSNIVKAMKQQEKQKSKLK